MLGVKSGYSVNDKALNKQCYPPISTGEKLKRVFQVATIPRVVYVRNENCTTNA
jgi:hypothetical protein